MYNYASFLLKITLSADVLIPTRPMAGLLYRQPVQKPAQSSDINLPGLGFALWPAELFPLQPFVPQAKAVAIPVENFRKRQNNRIYHPASNDVIVWPT